MHAKELIKEDKVNHENQGHGSSNSAREAPKKDEKLNELKKFLGSHKNYDPTQKRSMSHHTVEFLSSKNQKEFNSGTSQDFCNQKIITQPQIQVNTAYLQNLLDSKMSQNRRSSESMKGILNFKFNFFGNSSYKNFDYSSLSHKNFVPGFLGHETIKHNNHERKGNGPKTENNQAGQPFKEKQNCSGLSNSITAHVIERKSPRGLNNKVTGGSPGNSFPVKSSLQPGIDNVASKTVYQELLKGSFTTKSQNSSTVQRLLSPPIKMIEKKHPTSQTDNYIKHMKSKSFSLREQVHMLKNSSNQLGQKKIDKPNTNEKPIKPIKQNQRGVYYKDLSQHNYPLDVKRRVGKIKEGENSDSTNIVGTSNQSDSHTRTINQGSPLNAATLQQILIRSEKLLENYKQKELLWRKEKEVLSQEIEYLRTLLKEKHKI